MAISRCLTAVAIAGLLGSGVVGAAIYKSIDADGNIVYTDEPQGDAQPIELPPLSTIPPPKSVTPQAQEDAAEPGIEAPYQVLAIASPGADDTVRENSGNVAVEVTIKPKLKRTSGHRLQFFLDGEPSGEPVPDLVYRLPTVDRGTHTVEVAVVDGRGKEIIRSAGVRFYLHRESLNFPRGPQPPPPPTTPPPRLSPR